MGAKKQLVHFTVEGASIMTLGRNLMREGNWEKALRLITKGLQGISTDQAIAVLRGDFALGGENNSVSYFRQEDLDYKRELNWVYAGYINEPALGGKDTWYQPAAFVTDYGPTDVAWDQSGRLIEQPRGQPKNAFGTYVRAMHYARKGPNKAAVLRLPDLKKLVVLFENVASPPFWMVEDMAARNKTPQDALDDFYLNDRRPEARGHYSWYGETKDILEKAKDTKSMLKALRETHEPVTPLPKPKVSREQEEARLRAEIIKQAGDNWYTFKHGDKDIRVPEAPFVHWCLSRTAGAHLAPPWEVVSPSGLKMCMDDPYHTDWMLGAGLELTAMFGMEPGCLSDAAYAARRDVQEKYLGFKCAVLSGRGTTEDWESVLHPKEGDIVPENAVIILPSADPKYVGLVAQIKTGAVIVERGGSVAHLANVARERDVRMVRVEKARTLCPVGTPVRVCCETGTIDVSAWKGRKTTL
jgi:hypothetical protein